MIRINLLPHREAKRKQNKSAFYRLLILAAAFAIVIALTVASFIQTKISEQNLRNTFIKNENLKLDEQIKEIASLKEEIEALKARQQAVEDLQSDRNQPVYLLDELVKQIPEGIYLRSFKQEGQKVSLSGVAQSNERVSEILHNLTYESPWLEKPELIEIRASTVGQGRDTKKVFDFTMSVGIKRPRDKDKPATDGKSGASVAKTLPSVSTPAADKPTIPTDKPVDGKTVISKAASDTSASSASVNAPKKP